VALPALLEARQHFLQLRLLAVVLGAAAVRLVGMEVLEVVVLGFRQPGPEVLATHLQYLRPKGAPVAPDTPPHLPLVTQAAAAGLLLLERTRLLTPLEMVEPGRHHQSPVRL
jgi:hypothetical protein